MRYYTLKFRRLKAEPASLARGVSLGCIIGISPTLPFHTGPVWVRRHNGGALGFMWCARRTLRCLPKWENSVY
nr:DUF2062 domain-containing protein [Desulfobulbaceae bacterium]